MAGLVAHDVAQQLLEQRLGREHVHEAEGGEGQALDHDLHAEVGDVPPAVGDDVVEQGAELGADRVGAVGLLLDVAGEDLDVAGLVHDLGGGVVLGVDPRDGGGDEAGAHERALLAVEELRQHRGLHLDGERPPLLVAPARRAASPRSSRRTLKRSFWRRGLGGELSQSTSVSHGQVGRAVPLRGLGLLVELHQRGAAALVVPREQHVAVQLDLVDDGVEHVGVDGPRSDPRRAWPGRSSVFLLGGGADPAHVGPPVPRPHGRTLRRAGWASTARCSRAVGRRCVAVEPSPRSTRRCRATDASTQRRVPTSGPAGTPPPPRVAERGASVAATGTSASASPWVSRTGTSRSSASGVFCATPILQMCVSWDPPGRSRPRVVSARAPPCTTRRGEPDRLEVAHEDDEVGRGPAPRTPPTTPGSPRRGTGRCRDPSGLGARTWPGRSPARRQPPPRRRVPGRTRVPVGVRTAWRGRPGMHRTPRPAARPPKSMWPRPHRGCSPRSPLRPGTGGSRPRYRALRSPARRPRTRPSGTPGRLLLGTARASTARTGRRARPCRAPTRRPDSRLVALAPTAPPPHR